MHSPAVIKALEFLSVIPAVFLSGYCFMASQNALPALYEQRPDVSTVLFARIFRAGGPPAVLLAILSTIPSAYLAYAVSEKRALWIASAVIPPTLGLWTGVVMVSGIRRLTEISKSQGQQDRCEENLEHRRLLKRWVWQNYVRSAVVMAAGLIGFYASI